MAQAKPFVKWAGGKGSVVDQLNALLPVDFDSWEDVTYVEPFVGGGAMLFYMLQAHHNIRRVVINDINPDLIKLYHIVKTNPQYLIDITLSYQAEYSKRDSGAKKQMFYQSRDRFNNNSLDENERAALFLFLNHTCYNGLFRVNNQGKFNVPFGRYVSTGFDSPETIMATHRVLNSVEFNILRPGDYKNTALHLSTRGHNFVYFDPPYRPLSTTSYFKEYSNNPFGDQQQVELKLFCDRLNRRGCSIMLSNSDSKNDDGTSFFEALYEGYNITRIDVPRFINANGQGRSKIKEVLIRNY